MTVNQLIIHCAKMEDCQGCTHKKECASYREKIDKAMEKDAYVPQFLNTLIFELTEIKSDVV